MGLQIYHNAPSVLLISYEVYSIAELFYVYLLFCVYQAGLEITILLSLLSECYNYSSVPCSAWEPKWIFFKKFDNYNNGNSWIIDLTMCSHYSNTFILIFSLSRAVLLLPAVYRWGKWGPKLSCFYSIRLGRSRTRMAAHWWRGAHESLAYRNRQLCLWSLGAQEGLKEWDQSDSLM